MVYHRLLAAAFTQQLALEDRYSWLPQVAHGMMAAHGGRGVLSKVAWFYVSSYLLLSAIAAVALAHSLWRAVSPATALGLSAGLFVGLGLLPAQAIRRATSLATGEEEAFRARSTAANR